MMERFILLGGLIFFGLAMGQLSVFSFNRLPAGWLCDYGETPTEEWNQIRISSHGWGLTMGILFTLAAWSLTGQGLLTFWLGICSVWVLSQIAMSDSLFRIIPDQFIIALLVIAVASLWTRQTLFGLGTGAAFGGGVFFAIAIIGQLLFKKEVMGFGDVKLLFALGALLGVQRVSWVLLLSTTSFAVFYLVEVLRKRARLSEEKALGPFLAGAAYLCLLQQIVTGGETAFFSTDLSRLLAKTLFL